MRSLAILAGVGRRLRSATARYPCYRREKRFPRKPSQIVIDLRDDGRPFQTRTPKQRYRQRRSQIPQCTCISYTVPASSADQNSKRVAEFEKRAVVAVPEAAMHQDHSA